jgi:hypothetical protein
LRTFDTVELLARSVLGNDLSDIKSISKYDQQDVVHITKNGDLVESSVPSEYDNIPQIKSKVVVNLTKYEQEGRRVEDLII